MPEVLDAGHFEKEVEEIGAGSTTRYRKFDKRRSHFDWSTVASEARKRNDEPA